MSTEEYNHNFLEKFTNVSCLRETVNFRQVSRNAKTRLTEREVYSNPRDFVKSVTIEYHNSTIIILREDSFFNHTKRKFECGPRLSHPHPHPIFIFSSWTCIV